MAGYLFGLDSEDSLANAIAAGVFSTRLGPPKNNQWGASQEGTFADYSSMREGDNVYFFIKRKIYGIGTLVNINGDCKYLNFPFANTPTVSATIQNNRFLYLFPRNTYNNLSALQVEGKTYKEYIQLYRFICFFAPSPHFFENGIDMDDMLTSEPQAFKILRDFFKKSLIKIDDIENQAFKNLILRRNFNEAPHSEEILSSYAENHEAIATKLQASDYSLTATPFLNTINDGEVIRHEMAIEATIIYELSNGKANAIDVFGNWDYLSHQVVASPPKPNDYLDRIDVFGYSYIPHQFPTKAKFLILELKKEAVTKEHILQLMKYVDFIKSEYAYHDYSMIHAFLIGSSFEEDCIAALAETVTRNYIHGIRPSLPKTWRNVKLVKYTYNEEDEVMTYEIINDAN